MWNSIRLDSHVLVKFQWENGYNFTSSFGAKLYVLDGTELLVWSQYELSFFICLLVKFYLSSAFSVPLKTHHMRLNYVTWYVTERHHIRNTKLNTCSLNVLCSRIGEPDECAGTVAFLVSDDATYITGETVTITGGMNNRL